MNSMRSCRHPSARRFFRHKRITMRIFSSFLQRMGPISLARPSPLQSFIPRSNVFAIESQQQRFRWTKAKKKRTIRFHRRQKLQEVGKELPKPPYYFPRDTPVVNALSKESRIAESQKFDEKAAAELNAKLQQQQPVLRFHMTGLRMSDRVRKLFDLHNGSQQEVVKAQKQRAMELFQLRPGDTGSSAVQVIALTTRIQQLRTHMSKHRKDVHSKRGLDALYVRRRKLLDYMERKDFDSYRRVVKTLGLLR